jgi:predicted aldo/keto reductase-like oxidoreductase
MDAIFWAARHASVATRAPSASSETIFSMWTKPYGKTGKNISVIGFGGMRFPQPHDLDASAELLRYAHAKGINYFDTAPFYCDDKSEEIFGRAFQTLPRDSFYVSTKSMAATDDALRAGLEKSLRRLRVDYIDFFHIWCLLQPGQLKERLDKGAIPAAQRAKEEGLIKHLVVSSHLGGDDNADVLASGLFEGITIGYNALNFPFRGKTLEAALRHNVGVVTMNPLGGGLIPRHAKRLAFLQGPQDNDVVQAAIRFNVSQSAITAALVGFASKEEIDQAVAAVENFTPYPADHIERVKANIGASFEGFCTGCGYCLPCPVELPIPKLMDAFNHRILEGTDESVINRLKWHWSLSPDVAAACLECGDCEATCTQHLPLRERLHAIAALAQK